MKYASGTEIVLFVVGMLMSCGVGSSMPDSFFIFSDLVNDFLGVTNPGNLPLDDLISKFAILGGATVVVGFFQMFCLQLSAKRQARRIRQLLFKV